MCNKQSIPICFFDCCCFIQIVMSYKVDFLGVNSTCLPDEFYVRIPGRILGGTSAFFSKGGPRFKGGPKI